VYSHIREVSLNNFFDKLSLKSLHVKIKTKEEETYKIMFIDKLLKSNKYKLCSYIYALLGIFIVIFPPKFQYKSYESKFGFFLSIDKIDFYFFIYEIISYMLIGFIFYFLFVHNKHNSEDKINTEDARSALITQQSIQLLKEAVFSLCENVQCQNPIKAKIVILTIYLKLVSSLSMTADEEKIMQKIINSVLENDDENFEIFMKYVDVYSTYHSSIAQSNRDDSQKLFALSKMHALYLFQDKTEDELLTETTLITSYYQLVLKVAQMIKI